MTAYYPDHTGRHVIARMDSGDPRRVYLAASREIECRRGSSLGTGVTLEGVWRLADDAVVIATYSLWDRGDGICSGDQYRLLDPRNPDGRDAIARLVTRHGVDESDIVLPAPTTGSSIKGTKR